MDCHLEGEQNKSIDTGLDIVTWATLLLAITMSSSMEQTRM